MWEKGESGDGREENFWRVGVDVEGGEGEGEGEVGTRIACGVGDDKVGVGGKRRMSCPESGNESMSISESSHEELSESSESSDEEIPASSASRSSKFRLRDDEEEDKGSNMDGGTGSSSFKLEVISWSSSTFSFRVGLELELGNAAIPIF